MKKSEYKAYLREVFSREVEGLTLEEEITLIEKTVLQYQIACDSELPHPNKGNPWLDEELRIILRSVPTKENCLKYARLFGRSCESIELIYRWAATSEKDIQKRRENDIFVKQVKRIAKEVGWVA